MDNIERNLDDYTVEELHSRLPANVKREAKIQKEIETVPLFFGKRSYFFPTPMEEIYKKFPMEFECISNAINLTFAFLKEIPKFPKKDGVEALQMILIRLYDNLIGINQMLLTGYPVNAFIIVRPFLESYTDFMIICNKNFFIKDNKSLTTLNNLCTDERITVLGKRYIEFGMLKLSNDWKVNEKIYRTFHYEYEKNWEQNEKTWGNSLLEINDKGKFVKLTSGLRINDWFGRTVSTKTHSINSVYSKLCNYVHGSPRAWSEIIKKIDNDNYFMRYPPYDNFNVGIDYIFEKADIINKYYECLIIFLETLIRQWSSLPEKSPLKLGKTLLKVELFINGLIKEATQTQNQYRSGSY